MIPGGMHPGVLREPAAVIARLHLYKLDEQTVMWVKNWLNNQMQMVVVSGTKSSWRPGTNRGPVLVNIFISYLNDMIECILRMFCT